MAHRTYTVNGRTFEIVLRGTPSFSYYAWTVEAVREGGNVLKIPGMESFIASREDDAYVQACDRIDQWLKSRRR